MTTFTPTATAAPTRRPRCARAARSATPRGMRSAR